MNLSLILQMIADNAGKRVGLTAGDVTLDYAALAGHAAGFAGWLAGRDAGSVVYLAENSAAAPIALFGAALAGRAYVPINYRLTDTEIAALLDRAGAAVVVSDRNFPGRPVIAPAALLDAREDGGMLVPDEADGVAVELFTSGTTGEPKAALLRHANLMSYILGTVEFAGAGEDEATLITVPPYHIAGIMAVLSSVYAGRKMVQMPAFSPEAWLDAAARHAVTSAFLVPTMLQRIVDHLELHPQKAALPALRTIAYGGGRMSTQTIARAVGIWPHVDFTNAYGLTETSSTICLLTPDDHRAAHAASDPSVRVRIGSVGRALPGVEIEIRDELGQALESGELGLVHVRGGQVSGEYRDQGSLLDADGWFSTRDRGWLDHDGYLFLDGRADDVIVRGGENISPGEVEEVIRAHPDVIDVAVVGIPDTEWGETVAAAVVLRPDARSDAEILRSAVRIALRSSRVPALIRFVDILPYNETGKLLRRSVRQYMSIDGT